MSRPGWYPDPDEPGVERWWDGTGWTYQTRDTGGTTAPSAPSYTPADPADSDEPWWYLTIESWLVVVGLGLLAVVGNWIPQAVIGRGSFATDLSQATAGRGYLLAAAVVVLVAIAGFVSARGLVGWDIEAPARGVAIVGALVLGWQWWTLRGDLQEAFAANRLGSGLGGFVAGHIVVLVVLVGLVGVLTAPFVRGWFDGRVR